MDWLREGLFIAGAVACKSLAVGAVDAGVLFVASPEEEQAELRADPMLPVFFFAAMNILNTALEALPAAYALLRKS